MIHNQATFKGMKKHVSILLALAFCAFGNVPQAISSGIGPKTEKVYQFNDAEKIIAKYIEAVGGKAKTDKIKNSTMVMEAEFQGMSIVIKAIADSENGRMVQETAVMGNVASKTIYKDGKGIILAGGQQQEIPSDLAENLKAQTYAFPETRYAEFGYTLSLDGKETIQGEEAHKLSITTPSGNVTTEYYSVATGLKLMTKSDAAGEITYSEYQDFNGMKFPSVITIKSPMLPVELKAKLVSLSFDQQLSDADFN
jgi:hypothetical protein